MKRAMLPLNALRAFDAAARHLSFKLAADELSVTPAAVSQQIRHLEDVLGVELFKRTNRALILTERAQLALHDLKQGFEHLEDSVKAIQNAEENHTLRISVSPSFASKWLVPRLANYYELNSDAIVKVQASMALTDFRTEDIDLAIRFGAGDYPGLHVEELMRETVFPVASPELCEQENIRCCTPADLAKTTLIHDDSFIEDDSAPSWSMWLKAAGLDNLDGHRALHFNTHSLAVEAAVAGRGVALARSSIAAEDIKAGRLRTLFGEAIPVNFAHYIVCPEENLKLARVEAFIDWLKTEAGQQADDISAKVVNMR